MKRPIWTYGIRHFGFYWSSEYKYLRLSPFGYGFAASTNPVFIPRQRELFKLFGVSVSFSWFSKGASE